MSATAAIAVSWEPSAFWLGERRLAVRALTDRWYAPQQRWFRVEADDESMYVLA